MSIEELLKERVKVVSPYPEIERHNIRVGDIITISDSAMQADYLQDGCPVVAIDHKLFPLIFKPLSWWEEREAGDMPLHVKVMYESNSLSGGRILKASKWYYDKEHVETENGLFNIVNLFPATEAEYNQSTTKPTDRHEHTN